MALMFALTITAVPRSMAYHDVPIWPDLVLETLSEKKEMMALAGFPSVVPSDLDGFFISRYQLDIGPVIPAADPVQQPLSDHVRRRFALYYLHGRSLCFEAPRVLPAICTVVIVDRQERKRVSMFAASPKVILGHVGVTLDFATPCGNLGIYEAKGELLYGLWKNDQKLASGPLIERPCPGAWFSLLPKQ